MSHEQVIQVISKPSHLRTNNEIEVILPWLRKKSNLLAGMNKNVILDVVRGCQYQRSAKDEVVIKQGDRGECFYIILKGLVSVYIDAKMSGEDDNGAKEDKDEETTKQEQDEDGSNGNSETPATESEDTNETDATDQVTNDSQNHNESPSKPKIVSVLKKKITLTNIAKGLSHQFRQKKHDERKMLGKFIVRFEQGRSFGEIALLSDDNVRNASIITDDETDFLVIHRDLYNSTLKAYQEKQFQEVKDFIDSQPLFFDWPPKFLSLLQMSIRKETFNIMTPIVTQGGDVDGLIFIIQGESKIVVEASKHRNQYPDRWPFKDKYAVFEDDDFMRSRFGKKSSHGKRPRKGSAKSIKQKQIAIRRGQGYAAAEKKAFQRSTELCFLVKGDIIGDVETVMNLPTYAYTVLCTSETQAYILDSKNYDRLITKKNPETSLLLRDLVETKLQNRISTPQGAQIPLLRHLYFDMTSKTEDVVVKQLTARNSKELPDKEILLQHLLNWFVHWKGPLIQPYVPGNVYYKNLMQERARIRASVRKAQLKMERRPTVALLPNTLRKQFDDRKPRSISALKDAMKKLKSDKITDILSSRRDLLYRGAIIPEEQEDDVRQERIDVIEQKHNVTSLVAPHKDIRKDSLVRFQDEPVARQEDLNAEAIERITLANSTDAVDKLSTRTVPVDSGEPVFITERSQRKHHLPVITGRPNSATNRLSTDGDQLNLPSIGGSASKLKFFSQYVRDNLTPDEDDDGESSYKDYETSDSTLSFLERRLQKFLTKNDSYPQGGAASEESPRQEINLPKLKRYTNENSTIRVPRPGGRVMVKRHSCKFAHCNFVVKGHRHSKYFIVDELPVQSAHHYNRKQVKRAQMVMDVFMGGILPNQKSQSAKTSKSTMPT